MKDNSKISVCRDVALLCVAIVAMSLVCPGQCSAAEMALMLQQTPVDGGTIEPGTGVHRFSLNTQVTLKAVPRPGYQFVYWLGDVSEPTSCNTTAYLDSPKIIIAVFERVEYESLAAAEMIRSGGGGGGLRASAADYSRAGGGGGGGKRPHKWYPPSFPEDEPPEDDFQGPDDGDDLMGPDVPEPATVVLLGIGGLLVGLGRHRAK